MLPNRYEPPPAVLERTRFAVAQLVLPVLFTIVRVALRLLPRAHPYRIYVDDRVKAQYALLWAAASTAQPGRTLPVWLNVMLAWMALDSISVRVPGPFSLVPEWSVDDRVRIFDRIGDAANALTTAAGLLF